jgi:serine/threonine protein kinase
MGQVLGATHLELQQKVALKFMSPAIMEIPGAVARFTREARAAAKLRSKHVCRVLDIGETPEGAKYIVIEYLEGSDLSELLMVKERLPSGEAIDYIVQACDGLGEAHEFDIVHRDIKPANLFLDKSREGESLLKVLDFGISKNLGGDPDMIVTATNALMGSPLYMSPEQLLSPKTVDTRADIWSLGIVLHELLVGKPPFQGETLPEVIALIVNDSRTPADAISEEIPEELRAIIAKCLERDPVRRYRTAEQLADALRAVAPEIAGVGRKGHALETVAMVAEKPAMPWKLISVAGAAVVMAGALFLVLSGGDSKSKAPAVPKAAPSATSGVPEGAATPAVVPAVLPDVVPEVDASPSDSEVLAGSDSKDEPETTPAVASEPRSKGKGNSKSKAKAKAQSKAKSKGKGQKQGLMDPSEERRGTRAPGDDDVMDPEL